MNPEIETMTTLFAPHALLPTGWAADVRIAIEDGRIASVATGTPAQPGDERAGIVLPAMPNLHSHAFQRAMAGLAERRGPGEDSFWSWRDAMYRHALAMTPDEVEAVAAMLYVEMLEAGFGRVGEFHYLHHDRDGRTYGNIAEMAERIVAAATTAGIGLTLLPVFYAQSGFGGLEPSAGQRRFVNTLDSFARLHEASNQACRHADTAVLGVAPHSLRAVTPQHLAVVAGLAGPVHIHVAEQTKEVEDCIAWSGARPVEWLLDHVEVGERWCLIHATHMTDRETEHMARSGAVAGLCPITEANLGDGIFPGERFLGAHGRFGIGTDSNVLIGVADELRQLEYSQRLATRRRTVLAAPGGSNGRALYDAALNGGTQAIGGREGLAEGCFATFLSVDPDHPLLAGRAGDAILDSFVFAGGIRPDRVWSQGRKVVDLGRHVDRDRIEARFKAAMTALAEA